jgi:hypothetical protein
MWILYHASHVTKTNSSLNESSGTCYPNLNIHNFRAKIKPARGLEPEIISYNW